MKKKLVKTVAIVCAMSMLIGGTALASTSKMVTKRGDGPEYSGIVSASTKGFSYTLHPYTKKTLTGTVQQADSGAWKAVSTSTASAETTYTNTTAGYTTYRLALTGGTGYGIIKVE
ncbi:MAG: hypothetical protein HDR01_04140 [Lachnospiraceae bacterium]|nr:hypothetical protein [Lachnospiraceae bacterium]